MVVKSTNTLVGEITHSCPQFTSLDVLTPMCRYQHVSVDHKEKLERHKTAYITKSNMHLQM